MHNCRPPQVPFSPCVPQAAQHLDHNQLSGRRTDIALPRAASASYSHIKLRWHDLNGNTIEAEGLPTLVKQIWCMSLHQKAFSAFRIRRQFQQKLHPLLWKALPKFQPERGWTGAQLEKNYFNLAAYRRALHSENLPSALYLVRKLIVSLQEQHPATRPQEHVEDDAFQEKQIPARMSSQGSKVFAELLAGLHKQYFKMCLRRKNLDATFEYAKAMPPDPHLFSTLLKQCLDHGNLRAVTKAVEVRRNAGLEEDAFCYTALLKAASREKNATIMNDLFEKAWTSGINDVSVFNVLISHQNTQRHFKASFATFDRMLSLGIEPDGITMNLLISAAGAEGNFEKVDELYRQMVSIGPAPSSRTYVHLFTAFHNSLKKNTDWIFKVYDDMISSGIEPITQHFVTFLVACSEASLSTHQTHNAFARAMVFCKKTGGDCSVYSALLKFCVYHGMPEKAVDVWRQIQKERHEVDTYVFNTLFAACAAYNSPELRLVMTEAFQDLKHYRKQVLANAKANVRTYKGLIIAFNSLLNACTKSSMISTAEDIFRSMQRCGPAPDLISYNTLLAGYAKVSDTEKAFAVFDNLCELSSRPNNARVQLRPNEKTFGSLLNCCARAGDVEAAKRIFEMMRQSGIFASAEAYTSLIHSCVKNGSQDSIQYAFQVFNHMKLEGVYPTAVTYGCMMNACEAMNKVDDALRLYTEACSQGVPPTDGCHNILINSYAKNNRLDEALNMVKTLARQKGRPFQAGALNSLVRALAPDYLQRALRMLSFVRTLNLKVHSETLSILLASCAQASLIEEAHTFYWELSKEGSITTSEAGSHLIMALCRADQKERALKVFKDMARVGRHSTVIPKTKQSPMQSQPVGAAEQLGLRLGLSQDSEAQQDISSIRLALRPTLDVTSFKQSWRTKKAVYPHARAMATLVQAYASENLDQAIDLYDQLQRDSIGVSAVTLSNRYMWQSLIEAACRKNQLSLALKIFDDFKRHCAKQTALHRFDDDADSFVPRLSNVTLAFLESCCRNAALKKDDPLAAQYEMRVFDVCATMRQQQDRRKQAALPKPKKLSHHFAEDGM